jgi:hypothetical protein
MSHYDTVLAKKKGDGQTSTAFKKSEKNQSLALKLNEPLQSPSSQMFLKSADMLNVACITRKLKPTPA